MIWTVCFIVSILFAAAGVLCCRLAAVRSRGGAGAPRSGILPDNFSPVLLLSLGLLFAIAALAFPVYRAGRTALEDIAAAMLCSLRVIVLGEDFSVMRTAVSAGQGAFANVYLAYGALLYIVQPISTTLFLLSLFKSLALWARYRFMRGRDVYVFSSLDDRTLRLAQTIPGSASGGAKRPTVVFADAKMSDEYDRSRYEARKLGAMCFKRSIEFMDLSPAAKRRYHLLLVGEDEYENVRGALALARKHESRGDVEITALASSYEALLLIDARRRELFGRRENDKLNAVGLFAVNATSAVIYSLLDTHPLFGAEDSAKDAPISVLLVGGDSFIKELFKAVLWCGQVEGRPLKVRVACENAAHLEKELRLESPELFTSVLPDGRHEYDIGFLPAAVSTDDLANCVSDCRDATYVVSAPGDDTLNVGTAVTLRTLYQRLSGLRGECPPEIFALVRDDERNKLAAALSSVEQNDSYRITPFGSFQSTFDYGALVDSPYLKLARTMHGRKKFYSEYDKSSKIARIIHVKYQAYGAPGCRDLAFMPVAGWTPELFGRMIAAIEPDPSRAKESDYTTLSDLRKRMCKLEHRRWNAYMRSSGYVCPAIPDDDGELEALTKTPAWQKYHLAKTHMCIVPWEDDSGASQLERYSRLNVGGHGYRDYDDILTSSFMPVMDALKELNRSGG